MICCQRRRDAVPGQRCSRLSRSLTMCVPSSLRQVVGIQQLLISIFKHIAYNGRYIVYYDLQDDEKTGTYMNVRAQLWFYIYQDNKIAYVPHLCATLSLHLKLLAKLCKQIRSLLRTSISFLLPSRSYNISKYRLNSSRTSLTYAIYDCA